MLHDIKLILRFVVSASQLLSANGVISGQPVDFSFFEGGGERKRCLFKNTVPLC